MSEPTKIASSVRAIDVDLGAPLVHSVLEVLKDMDAQRIAKDDSAIIRKAVLGLIEVIAELELRVAQLENR